MTEERFGRLDMDTDSVAYEQLKERAEAALGELYTHEQWEPRIDEEETEKLRADVRAYMAHLESQLPRWIPVEERLPEREGHYIVTWHTEMDPWPHVETEWYSPAKGWMRGNSHITHWMLPPELPK